MDRLREENEALLRRLKELEESGARGAALGQDGEGGEGHGEELVPRASWELANKEKEDLEETVKQKEKRLLRLQQVSSLSIVHHRFLCSNAASPQSIGVPPT